MTGDDINHDGKGAASATRKSSFRHLPWLKLPAPVKAVFDKFPLIIYERNELPIARIGAAQTHILYLFTTEEDARLKAPSFNPTCLKWQAYLLFCGVDFATHSSSNHASPSGALPFLIPSSDHSPKRAPISTRQLQAWAEREAKNAGQEAGKREEDDKTNGEQHRKVDLTYEAYSSLLDHRIRNAYLFSLYICDANFNSITEPLYVDSSSRSTSVRVAQAHQLRKVARSELLKQSQPIDAEAIYRECDSAFNAISTLLGNSLYFFGKSHPGLLDAAVFGYTNVLLEGRFKWKEDAMRKSLRKYNNLIHHRERILQKFFPPS